MRLEFEPNVTAFPLVENEMFDEVIVPPDSQTYLKKGISAAQAGDRELARTLLTKVTNLDPKNEDAWMWLASISQYPEELLAFLNNVLEINPENGRAAEWRTATCSLLAKTFVGRGATAHDEGTPEHAQQAFDQALTHDPDCESAWLWKANLADTDDERMEFLNRVLSINVDNQEAQDALNAIKLSRSSSAVAAAKAAAGAGDSPKALEMLDDVLQNDPANLDAWILRSHLSPNLQDKLYSLEKILEIDTDNAAARSSVDFLSTTVAPEPVVESEATATKVEAAPEPVIEVVDEVEMAVETHETVRSVEEMFGPSDEEMDATRDTLESLPPLDEIFEQEARSFQPLEEVEEEVFAEAESIIEEIEEEGFALQSEPVEAYEEVFASPATEHIYKEEVSEPEEESVENAESSYDLDPYKTRSFDDLLTEPSLESIFDNAAHASVESPFDAPASVEPAPASVGVGCAFCSASNDPQAFECGTCHASLSLSDIESLLSNNRVNTEMVQLAITQMEAEWNLREFDETELTNLGIAHFNLRNYESGLKYLQEASRANPNDVILSGQINTLVIRLDEMRRQEEVHDSRPVGKTILVVDDSATVRKLISGKLEKSGHTVVCAEDGVEGLARIEEQVPDLVLLDITMPRMDGYEVCKQIRANPSTSAVPVVMISGKDGFFDKVRGRMAGTTGYVTKPFGPETLMKALETYLVQDDVIAK